MGILAFIKSLFDALSNFAGPIVDWIKSNQDKQKNFFDDIKRDDSSREFDSTRADLEKKAADDLAKEAEKIRNETPVSKS